MYKEIRELVKDIEPQMSILDIEGECLYNLVKKYCPEDCSIVEIGSWKGRSTIWLGLAAEEIIGTVYAIDPHTGEGYESKTSFEEFRANIKKAGLENIVVPIRLTSEEASKDRSIPNLVDFVFIDGDHTYMGVLKDTRNWSSTRLKEGGIVSFHDTIAYEGPRITVKVFFSLPWWRPVAVVGQIVAFKYLHTKSSNYLERQLWYLYWRVYGFIFISIHNLIPKPIKELLKKC